MYRVHTSRSWAAQRLRGFLEEEIGFLKPQTDEQVDDSRLGLERMAAGDSPHPLMEALETQMDELLRAPKERYQARVHWPCSRAGHRTRSRHRYGRSRLLRRSDELLQGVRRRWTRRCHRTRPFDHADVPRGVISASASSSER